MTKPLSPAGQAVMDAFESTKFADHYAIAAVIRAAADQVVPEEPELNPLKAWSVEDWNHMNTTKYQREECRRQLLVIAAELEGFAND